MTAAVGEHPSLRQQVLLDLAKRDKTNTTETFRGITEAAAMALDVTRAGIWRLVSDRTAMVCDDLYDNADHQHETGYVRKTSDDPAYFDDLLAGRAVCAPSRMEVPIWSRGTLYGVVSHEQEGPPRHWRRDEVEFAVNLADIASLSLEACERRTLEERWSTVIGSIAELIVVLDRNGDLLHSNAAHTRPLLARIRDEVFSLEDRRKILDYRDLEGRSIPHDDWPGPRALRGDRVQELFGAWHKVEGFLGYFRVFCTPVLDGDEINGAVGVLTDVTDEIQFERLKAEFLATLGHELKPPVAAIKAAAHDVLRHVRLEAVPNRQFAAIERAARRMERLLDNVIEISTLGELMLVREPVDAGLLVQAQIDRVEQSARGRRILLTGPEGVELVVDRPRIEQVIQRLLDNALRYSPDGGDVEVTLTVVDDGVVISVRDHGIGIPADKQPHVFDMFFRAHVRTAHDYGGLGLGLYLSREIARLHGGDLWFESVEGQGSTFHLRLPREVAM